jgi:hypothetical protein
MQRNSVASRMIPSGITIKAGPGRTIIRIPAARMLPPISAIKGLRKVGEAGHGRRRANRSKRR